MLYTAMWTGFLYSSKSLFYVQGFKFGPDERNSPMNKHSLGLS